jgi:hypothetical protein
MYYLYKPTITDQGFQFEGMEGMEDEFEISNAGGNEEDSNFDQIVGTLQEIILDPSFNEMQKKFCNRNCM